jgi:hypothetical protein
MTGAGPAWTDGESRPSGAPHAASPLHHLPAVPTAEEDDHGRRGEKGVRETFAAT